LHPQATVFVFELTQASALGQARSITTKEVVCSLFISQQAMSRAFDTDNPHPLSQASFVMEVESVTSALTGPCSSESPTVQLLAYYDSIADQM
jgi:hypothetical protein